ncbi:DUF3467 domain-containing protein [Methanococcoides seepicolus]|uniref:DUF3467 domain-containing protein n=1 Tax=Methanococcoides seepicolus TaxID=2828780 RepID=A0A9E4ZJV2_9EURY|nr:DUF3467 domain-containing protein [Methanococcoides seepicolus]MCM1987754.1 DUF3467 domain-containing protein [Methanococcoides seepicolus]
MVKEEKIEEEEKVTGQADINKLYDTSDIPSRINVTHTKYSNLASINVANRDVHIDFLELPGVRMENELLINATRVYMSHAAAQKFAKALQNVLDDVHSQGIMEMYGEEE